MNTAYTYIKSDCYRYTEKADFKSVLKLYLKNRTFRWQVAFRLCNAEGFIRYLGYALWVLNSNKKLISIARTTKIGYGLYIGHNGPVVVNRTAVIGNNCNLSQFTSIGSNFKKAAIIGNNVYIGPNVSIVENVKIGDNATIGAGSVVVKDIPENATAAGNYAKVLNYNDPGRFVHRRWGE